MSTKERGDSSITILQTKQNAQKEKNNDPAGLITTKKFSSAN